MQLAATNQNQILFDERRVANSILVTQRWLLETQPAAGEIIGATEAEGGWRKGKTRVCFFERED